MEVAPSASVRSLINTFEVLESPSPHSFSFSSIHPAKSTHTLTASTLRHHSSFDDCSSPTADSLSSFEPLQPTPSPTPTPSPSRSPSPAMLGRVSSFIDIHELGSFSGTPPPPALPPRPARSATSSPSPPVIVNYPKPRPIPAPIQPPQSQRDPGHTNPYSASALSSGILISFDSLPSSSASTNYSISPSRNPAPPLPPRKSTLHSSSSSPSASETSLSLSNITIDDKFTYPSVPPSASSTSSFVRPRIVAGRANHKNDNSVSSLHSVSLSSDGTGDFDDLGYLDREENVSVISIATDASGSSAGYTQGYDYPGNLVRSGYATNNHTPRPKSKTASGGGVPKLPPRPSATQKSSSSSTLSVSSFSSGSSASHPPSQPQLQYNFQPRRRVAPSPPTRGSKTSSPGPPRPLTPISPTHPNPAPSLLSGTPPTHRRTPIPPPIKARYDALFSQNLCHSKSHATPPSSNSSSHHPLVPPKTLLKSQSVSPPRRNRTNTGWRGTSMDAADATATSVIGVGVGIGASVSAGRRKDKESPESAGVGKAEAELLDGCVVKMIWSCSKLDRGLLRAIWEECDLEKRGSLDREAFARGMWRIDEELRRAAKRPKDPRQLPSYLR